MTNLEAWKATLSCYPDLDATAGVKASILSLAAMADAKEDVSSQGTLHTQLRHWFRILQDATPTGEALSDLL